MLIQRAVFNWEKSSKPWVWLLSLVENQRLIISNCWEIRKKLKLKYEVNLRFETRKKNRVQTWKWKAEFWVYFNRPIYRWSEYSSHRLAGRMAYSCKKKKSSAWLTSTEPNRSVSTFIIILIFFCRYINRPAWCFLKVLEHMKSQILRIWMK